MALNISKKIYNAQKRIPLVLMKRFVFCLVIVMGIVLIQSVLCSAQTKRKAEEYYIKAGYIYRFVHFVSWPEIVEKEVQKDSKIITFGILGEDPFEDFLDNLDGSVISGKKKKFRVERLGPFKPDLNLKKYDLLFVCSSEQNNLHEIINSL